MTGKGFFRVQLFWFLAVSLIPLAAASYMNYRNSHNSLEQEVIAQLKNTAFHKTQEIDDFFNESTKSLNWEARRDNVRTQLQALTEAFNASGLPLEDFIYSLEWTEITNKTTEQFDFFLSINEFYDVFLIDHRGNILYSAGQEADLGTNIFTGAYAQSHFGQACRTASNESRTVFSDFGKYLPSRHADACFLITPVYSLAGEMAGLMAIQLSIAKIDRIMQSNDLTRGVVSYLIGPDLLLRSHSTALEQASPVDIRIETAQSKSWLQQLRKQHNDKAGQSKSSIYTNHEGIMVLGLYSPITIKGVPLAVITEIPVAAAFEDLNRQAAIALLLFFAVGGIVLLLALWAARRVTTPLHLLTMQANRLADGDLENIEQTVVSTDDEFGRLSKSFQELATSLRAIALVCNDISLGIFDRTVHVRGDNDILAISVNKMIASFQDVVAQADSISTGDFAVSIEPRSEQDSLSIALRRMATNLEEQDWVKTGVAELSRCMQGEQDLATLSRNVLDFLGGYLQVQVGVFFVLEGRKLHRQAGYALKADFSGRDEFVLGEGLIGQAALEKKALIFNHVPPEHLSLSIDSGLGSSSPASIIVLPLEHDGVLKGVMEFGASREFTPLEADFLEQVSKSIAITIHTAQARHELQSLLEETQRQSEELQSQQEELRVANEELEEQSEELRAANEELEEKTDYLQKQQQEIIQARAALEIKAGELGQASRYKSEFLANMSHELRSPLNSLLILARSLAENSEGNLTAEQLESARIISSSGRDLLNLINDILDLSKVEAGRLEIHRENLQLAAVKHHLEDRFSHLAKEKGLTFSLLFSPAAPETINTDEQRLNQILDNLLSNAIKFTSHGSVTLEVKPATAATRYQRSELRNNDAILSFSVIDTGIGISPDKQEAIFEAFRQGDGSTSRRYGGTGLGLTISRQLAGLLGGEIQLDSRPGHGCTFTLYLPLNGLPAEPAADSAAASPIADNAATLPLDPSAPQTTLADPLVPESFINDDRQATRAGDKSLLIIEDDKIFAQILVRMARDKGYKALAAGSGRSGILMAKEYQPKAIILDLGLPDLNGTTVLENLKDDLDTRHIPVHIVSASDRSSQPLLKGAMGFLTKPATREKLDQVFSQFEEIIHGGCKRLLLVDDDQVSRDDIQKLLTPQGIEIITADCGEAACQLLAAEPVDCIILDLGLPDMSGFDLLARIEENERLAKVPVIVYTGRDLTAEENERLRLYARTVVVKGAESNERLLDEVSLFMHSMTANLPPEQRAMIKMIHDRDEVFVNKKILLVDDDMRNTFALSGLLQKLGMQVAMAANGQQALDKLDGAETFDMVLMDIMMPVMDGYETTRRIKKQARFKDLPVIALTAKAMPEDRRLCLEAGADDYLAKPIDQERLLSLMRVWLFK